MLESVYALGWLKQVFSRDKKKQQEFWKYSMNAVFRLLKEDSDSYEAHYLAPGGSEIMNEVKR